MKHIMFILVVLLVFLPFSCKEDTEPATAGEEVVVLDKIPLRILYAGLSGTDREADFVGFLSEHFTEVKSVEVMTFAEEQADDFDVVLLDKDGIQWGSDGDTAPLYSALQLSDSYRRATVALGIPGAFLYDRMNLKPGYR